MMFALFTMFVLPLTPFPLYYKLLKPDRKSTLPTAIFLQILQSNAYYKLCFLTSLHEVIHDFSIWMVSLFTQYKQIAMSDLPLGILHDLGGLERHILQCSSQTRGLGKWRTFLRKFHKYVSTWKR